MTRYRYGACNSKGTQLWSRTYDDWDECYEDYVQAMQRLRDDGADLSAYKWRGIVNLEQAALLGAVRNIYADELYIKEGD